VDTEQSLLLHARQRLRKFPIHTDAPSWFDISKYDTQNFTQNDWWSELLWRWLLLPNLLAGRAMSATAAQDRWKDIRANGLVRSPTKSVGEGQFAIRLFNGHDWISVWQTLRHDFKLRALAEIDADPEPDYRPPDLTATADALMDKNWGYTYGAFKNTPEAPWPSAMLFVDLNAADDDLLKQFRTWLKEERADVESKDRPRSVSGDRVRKWHQYMILPYLDLQIYQLIEQVRLTDDYLAELLFPHLERTGEDIRKTIAPLAYRLLEQQFFTLGRHD